MNQFFELFGGPIAVFFSITATIFVTRRWKAGRAKNTRRFLVALLYWTPLFLLSCMVLHCFQNAYRAIVSLQETGVFNFYYYSLQLFGFVVGYQAYLLLKRCRQHAAGEKHLNPGFFQGRRAPCADNAANLCFYTHWHHSHRRRFPGRPFVCLHTQTGNTGSPVSNRTGERHPSGD